MWIIIYLSCGTNRIFINSILSCQTVLCLQCLSGSFRVNKIVHRQLILCVCPWAGPGLFDRLLKISRKALVMLVENTGSCFIWTFLFRKELRRFHVDWACRTLPALRAMHIKAPRSTMIGQFIKKQRVDWLVRFPREITNENILYWW